MRVRVEAGLRSESDRRAPEFLEFTVNAEVLSWIKQFSLQHRALVARMPGRLCATRWYPVGLRCAWHVTVSALSGDDNLDVVTPTTQEQLILAGDGSNFYIEGVELETGLICYTDEINIEELEQVFVSGHETFDFRGLGRF